MFQLSSVPFPPPVWRGGPHPSPVGFGSSGGLWSPWGLLRRGRPPPPPVKEGGPPLSPLWVLGPLVGYGPLGCS